MSAVGILSLLGESKVCQLEDALVALLQQDLRRHKIRRPFHRAVLVHPRHARRQLLRLAEVGHLTSSKSVHNAFRSVVLIKDGWICYRTKRSPLTPLPQDWPGEFDYPSFLKMLQERERKLKVLNDKKKFVEEQNELVNPSGVV